MGRRSASVAIMGPLAYRAVRFVASASSAMVSWIALPSNRRRIGQAFVRSMVRRTEFRWWHAVLFAYVALLWRSTRKTSVVNGGEYWKRIYEKGSAWKTFVAAHVVLFKYIVTKATLGALLLQNVTYQAVLAPRYAVDFMEKQSAALQERLQNTVEDFLDRQMDTIAEKVKDLLKDPYMPVSIQGTIEDFVDVLLPDLKLALFTKTNEYISSYRTSRQGLRIPESTSSIVAAAAAEAAARKKRQRRKKKRMKHGKKRGKGDDNGSIEFDNSQDGMSHEVNLTTSKNSKYDENLEQDPDESEDEVDSILQAIEDGEDENGTDTENDDVDTGDEIGEGSDDDDDELYTSGGFRDLYVNTVQKAKGEKKSKREDESVWVFDCKRRAQRTLAVFSNTLKGCNPSRANLRYHFSNLRAWVLYTLSPFDRSFWRSIRNPAYIVLTLVGLIPWIGSLWWLFVFSLHDKRDEYQLSQFIVGFQTAKFFSQGCLNLIRGSFLYYMCATRDVATCDQDGPKVRDYVDALSFSIQIVIVWLTFFILPHSEPCYSVNEPEHAFLLDEVRNDRSQAALRAKVRLGRGGRLMHLFWWDTFAVALVLCLALFSYFVLEQRDWKFRSTCYWLATIYGLTSLPFVPFKLPIMGNLLTPTKATGYTRSGDTVLRVIAPPPKAVLKRQTVEFEKRQMARRPSTLIELQQVPEIHSPVEQLTPRPHRSTILWPLGGKQPTSPASTNSQSPGPMRRDSGSFFEGSDLRHKSSTSHESRSPEVNLLSGFFLRDSFEAEMHRHEKKLDPIQEEDDESSEGDDEEYSFDEADGTHLNSSGKARLRRWSSSSTSSKLSPISTLNQSPATYEMYRNPSSSRNVEAASSIVANETTETSTHASNQIMRNLQRLRSTSSILD